MVLPPLILVRFEAGAPAMAAIGDAQRLVAAIEGPCAGRGSALLVQIASNRSEGQAAAPREAAASIHGVQGHGRPCDVQDATVNGVDERAARGESQATRDRAP